MPLRPNTLSAARILRSAVSISVSLRVPKSLWTIYTSKTNEWEFHPILITCAFVLNDMPVGFWGQKVKGQGHSRQWPEKPANAISSWLMELISSKLCHICIWAKRHSDYVFGSKGQGYIRRKHSRRQQPVEFHLVSLVCLSYEFTLESTRISFDTVRRRVKPGRKLQFYRLINLFSTIKTTSLNTKVTQLILYLSCVSVVT